MELELDPLLLGLVDLLGTLRRCLHRPHLPRAHRPRVHRRRPARPFDRRLLLVLRPRRNRYLPSDLRLRRPRRPGRRSRRRACPLRRARRPAAGLDPLGHRDHPRGDLLHHLLGFGLARRRHARLGRSPEPADLVARAVGADGGRDRHRAAHGRRTHRLAGGVTGHSAAVLDRAAARLRLHPQGLQHGGKADGRDRTRRTLPCGRRAPGRRLRRVPG